MTLVPHLIRKDLRAVAIVALIWIVLMSIEVTVQLSGAFATLRETSRQSLSQTLLYLLPFAEVAVVALIVSTVIHEDPLVDSRAFWLTRPVPRGQLFAAKVITLAVVIFTPALLALVVLLAWHHVPPVYMMRAGFEIVLWLAVPLLILTAAATLTPALSRYLLLLFGAIVTAITILGLMETFRTPQQLRVYEPRLPRYDDPASQVTVVLILIVGFCATIHQFYRRRDWRAALAGIALAAGLATAVARYWPGYTFFEAPEKTVSLGTNLGGLRLRPLNDQTLVSAYHPRELRSVAAPLVLAGLPFGYSATPFTLNGQLTRADGSVLRSGRAAPVQVTAKGEYQPSLTLAYGNDPIDAGPTKWEAWPVLLELPSGHRAAVRPAANRGAANRDAGDSAADGGPAYYAGSYSGTFMYRIARHEMAATLRLDQREAYADGPRGIRIVEAQDLSHSCRVTVEVTNTELTLASPREPAPGYFFIDRRTRASLRASRLSTRPGMLGPLRIGLARGRRIFTSAYVQWDVENPRDSSPGDISPCTDTNLIFVRTIPIGSMTQSIVLPDFRVQPTEDTYFRRQ